MKKLSSVFNVFVLGFSLALLSQTASFAQEEISWEGCDISKKAYMSEMAKAFEKETGIKINFKGGGATKGIRGPAAGTSEMGGSCRHLMNDSAERGVKLNPVGWDAIVVVVHKSNPVDNITHDQLKKILLGEIKNWKELGGKNQKIDFMERDSKTSGVGMMSRELIFGDEDIDFKPTSKFKSSGPLEDDLEKSPDGLALDGVSSAKKSTKIKILKLNGVAPTVENISNGKYKLYRPLYLVTKTSPSPKVAKFVNFVKSPKGQSILAKEGTVTLEQGKSLWPLYRANMEKVRGKKKGAFE